MTLGKSFLRGRLTTLCGLTNCAEEDRIKILRSAGLVSSHYDLTCLRVDQWYLGYKKNNLYKRYSLNECVNDPYLRIFMETIISALADYARGRPCDASKWILDLPPDRERCFSHDHICRDEAARFLISIGSTEEKLIGLTPGTLNSYMRKFRVQATGFATTSDCF